MAKTVKAFTPDEEAIARATPGGTAEKLRAVMDSRQTEQRIREARENAFRTGMLFANVANGMRGYREPDEDASLTRPMSATELAKLIGTVDPRGDRFISKYLATGVISARQVEGKDRVWVFDANELEVKFPNLDSDAILPK